MGEAYAMRLARSGCDVAVVDLVRERAESVAVSLRELGRRAVAIEADALDPASVDAATSQVEAELGPLNLLATVIGMAGWGPIRDMSLEMWQHEQAVNIESLDLTFEY
jgi:3-oxoacyl-[acyl-carrier protein] reductase